jgi:hypothetical protein
MILARTFWIFVTGDGLQAVTEQGSYAIIQTE